jgi:hypothetical protein
MSFAPEGSRRIKTPSRYSRVKKGKSRIRSFLSVPMIYYSIRKVLWNYLFFPIIYIIAI